MAEGRWRPPSGGRLVRWFGGHPSRARTLRRTAVAAVATALLVASGLVGSVPQAAADSCSPNPVVCENSKDGTPSTVWDVTGAGEETLQGFATDMSVNLGGTIRFKVQAQHAYTMDIYRLGWYDGDGARKIISLGTFPAQNQDTACVTQQSTDTLDCGSWAVSASWTVPTTQVSGVYLALLARTDTNDKSQIPFVVRDDSSTSALYFKTSDATWQAYNTYGGADFYQGTVSAHAFKISYNRPFATRGNFSGRDYLFSNEYPMLRFLERNGYDLSYTTDVDADRFGSLIKRHRVFLSVGHDEYWSVGERAAVEAARDAGTNLAFFSGNEVYWQTRWENSMDASNTPYRTLVCYKETWHDDKIDPSSTWTGTFRDPRFSPPSNGGRPENALTGQLFMSNSDDLALQVPAAQGKLRFWRETGLDRLTTTTTLAPHTIGYESDEDLDNGFRPPGLIRLSTTTGPTPQYLQDFGSVVEPGTTTHHLTLYRAASGALVFAAGTIQWAWGLDAKHDSEFDPPAPADSRMQQATVNLLADMGVQPATLMSTLDPASASTDTTKPTVTITSPASGASFANGVQVTVQGTASDAGGQVAGVEASTDGGRTWHPATGTTSWSYSYYATGAGSSTVQVRAIDDSVNIGAPASRQLTLSGPTSLFGNRAPGTPASDDPAALELGVKFIPQTDGYVSGVRFYKGSGNTGTHRGSLWSTDGELLATGPFTGETGSGWQTMTFATPVAVSAGATYIVSYTAPNGHYSTDPWFFIYTEHNAAPLVAPRDHEAGGNGVYGDPGTFPRSSFHAENYGVDVQFTPAAATPPSLTSFSPSPDARYVPVSVHPQAVFSKAIDPDTLEFTLTDGSTAVAGSVGYDAASRTASFTPASPLAAGHTFTVSVAAQSADGVPMTAPRTWSFTTDPANTVISTLFAANAVPIVTSSGDSAAVTLGVKFVPTVDGQVIGVRFYKGTGNLGTHKGSLWSADGTRLATATFSGETASGWQTVYFATPVSVTAGTAYIASYYAPDGHYAADAEDFANPLTNGPLTAPADSNGLYLYGADGFPTGSYQSTNYWVDPLFIATGTSPSPSSTPSPSASASPSPTQSPSPSPTGTQPPMPAGARTVFAETAVPANTSWNDPAAIEVGMRFSAEVAGSVHGVRFYKGTQNTGTHTGSLWSASGTRLATGTFVGETESGWQTMLFDTPVSITPNTTYVVSYYAPDGFYAVDIHGLATGVNNAPLHVPADGVYRYGGGFPTGSADHNYWVDVVFVSAS
jgi:Domain of unknown function (DUF4082)/Bacterial Ig-like domain/Bacterial Ig domain